MMSDIELQQGDEFAVQGKGFISTAIRFISKIWSRDNKARYSHVGIIINAQGGTFEALYNGIKLSHINKYKGRTLLIVRSDVKPALKRLALLTLQDKYRGKIYPYWRLVLHLVPPLAKLIHFAKIPVCSEGNAYYEKMLGLRSTWWGYMPDNLVDEWRIHRRFETIYEGEWE